MSLEFQEVILETFRLNENTGHEARYSVTDETNPRLRDGGRIVLDEIDPDDTIAEWRAKVQAQIMAQANADADIAIAAKAALIK